MTTYTSQNEANHMMSMMNDEAQRRARRMACNVVNVYVTVEGPSDGEWTIMLEDEAIDGNFLPYTYSTIL